MGAILDLVKNEVCKQFLVYHLDVHVCSSINSDNHKVSATKHFMTDLNAANTYPELVDVIRHWWTSFNSTQNTTEQAEAVLKAIISIK